MNVRILGALGVAAAFTLAACGSSSSAPSTLTKAEWVTQANAICKDLNDRSSAIKPTSEADLGPAITKVAALSAEDIVKLAALKPPAEIQADVTTMITAYESVNKGFQDAAAKVAAGDVPSAAKLMESASAAGPTGDAAANKLGATECSKNN